MAMLTGAWENTKLVCGNHPETGDLPEMQMEPTAHTLFYGCPKSSICNCNDDETPCKNRLSIYEYEKMLDHVASVIAEAEMEDEIPNLRNYKWRRKGLSFRVLEHDGDKMIISVVDKTVIG